MHALIIFVALFYSLPSSAKSCREYEKVAEYLNTKKFIAASRIHRAKKKEPELNLGDINQARTLSYRFPAFEELGFGKLGSSGWSPYSGRREKSVLHGKKIGWEIKNENGHARVRLDWGEDKGGHYNIEITQTKVGKRETHKLAVGFLCGNVKCTEAQVLKMAENL